MPGRPSIRWKVGEKEEVAREIRNFNSRRRRAIKNNPDLYGKIPTIPEKTTIKNITKREDLKRLLKDIELSKKPGAFKTTKVGDIQVTKWELEKTKSRLRTINARRAAKKRASKVSTEKGTMGTIQQNQLNPKKLSKPKTKDEWRKFVESVEKQSKSTYTSEKDELYRQNYFDAFTNTYGISESLVLWNILKTLTAEEIVEAMHENPILNINFLYDDRIENRSENMETVIEAWQGYINRRGR